MPLTAFLGLDQLPSDTLTGVLILLVLAAAAVGFLTDVILGALGFGIVGNGCLIFVGSLAGLAIWRHVMGALTQRDMLSISVTVGLSAIGLLILILLVRKALS